MSDLITKVDPSKTPQFAEVQWATMPYEEAPEGFLKYDPINFTIAPIQMQGVLRITDPRFAKDQPFVRTCSPPSPTNLGCISFDGCPVAKWWRSLRDSGKAPFNYLLRDPRTGGEDVEACHRTYVGRNMMRPNRLSHDQGRLVNGWEILTHKATVRRRHGVMVYNEMSDQKERKVEWFEEKFDHPAPVYAAITGEDWSMIGAAEDGSSAPPIRAYVPPDDEIETIRLSEKEVEQESITLDEAKARAAIGGY